MSQRRIAHKVLGFLKTFVPPRLERNFVIRVLLSSRSLLIFALRIQEWLPQAPLSSQHRTPPRQRLQIGRTKAAPPSCRRSCYRVLTLAGAQSHGYTDHAK